MKTDPASGPSVPVVISSDKNWKANRMRQMALRSSNHMPGVKRRKPYSDEWYTPPDLVKSLGPFDLDPCAGPMAHATINIVPPGDGLAFEWEGRVWLNPPYSTVHEWLTKFISHANGIALVNARPETEWFQNFARGADGFLWLRRRIVFLQADGSASRPPVGSVLVAYGKQNAVALVNSNLPGIYMSR